MTDFDEVRIQRTAAEAPPAPPPPPSRRVPPAWIAIACAVVLAAAGYFVSRLPRARDDGRRTATEQTVNQPGGARSTTAAADPLEDIQLPPLDETDALVRRLVSRLSSHPRVAAWLTSDQLIRNFTLVVINIADGRTPAPYLGRLAPDAPFRAAQNGTAIHIDPRSFQRYDTHANAVGAIDAVGAARLYAMLEPRIEEANRELGSPHGDFDRAMERAIAQLLQTPVPDGSIAVEPWAGTFTYRDPSLESLSGAQKQLLRMGPANMRTIQSKLREVAQHLGVNPAAATRN